MSQNNNNRGTPMRLTSFVTTDLCGITRGRSLPESEVAEQLATGCGWVPANSALTPQDIIAEDNPWGSHGDLRLLPDPASRVRLESGPDQQAAPLDYLHGDLVLTDGSPWPVCPRTLLRDEIARYRQLDLQVTAAFEHEFNLLGLPDEHAAAFSLQAQRQTGNFGGWLMSALEQIGAEPEMFLPEYGRNQYEVTCRPTQGVAAADRAVNVREVTREIARQFGWRSSFTPLLAPGAVTNGVHLHLSLQRLDGTPVFYDEASATNLSKLAEHWAAGVLRHLPALCALTAPTAVSYLRLKPHHWSAAYACLGLRNREAALRICPVVEIGGKPKARQFNLEFRPMDATASPHLAMAAVLIAGRLGIEQELPLSAVTDVDPHSLGAADRERLGIKALPGSLDEAQRLLMEDGELCNELPSALLETYFAMKRQELALTRDLSEEQLCESYAKFY
ncbi:glutamine synthetase [Pseudomonas sp. NY15181]|uniref:glutamine synthetase n=1 Tax=Pseudomonas sp. NY15181 TaxID=3400349 RepID=UPI003A855AC9